MPASLKSLSMLADDTGTLTVIFAHNSAFHPYGVDKSSTNLPGWGEGGAVTSVRWQITLWSHWQVASRSSEVNFTKNYTLLYLSFFTFSLASLLNFQKPVGSLIGTRLSRSSLISANRGVVHADFAIFRHLHFGFILSIWLCKHVFKRIT